MHIQIITFELEGMSDADYRRICDQFAPVFAEVPGLLAKAWLADEATNTYGGVYTWADPAAMAAYTASDLYRSIASNPSFIRLSSRDFGILAGPTSVTTSTIAIPA